MKYQKIKPINFSPYVYKVLKQVHPDTGISQKAMAIMNDFLNDMFDKIASTAKQIMEKEGKKTMESKEIMSATIFLLPGELAVHGVSEGIKAVTKFNSSV